MSQAYVDDHRFLLYRGGTVRDINHVISGPQLRDDLDALSLQVTFQALRNDKNDRYAHSAPATSYALSTTTRRSFPA